MAESTKPRVLITGGSGFIGTNLTAHYLAAGCDVMNVDIKPPAHPGHEGVWKELSILDKTNLRQAVSDFSPDVVHHLAARTDLDGKSLAEYRANVEGVANVIEAVNAAPQVRCAIYASTRLVFRIDYKPKHEYDYLPSTHYGESKIEGEKLVRSQGEGCTPWLLVRPTSIWGPWFHVPYRDFFMNIARGRYVHPKGRTIRKSFGYVGNTVHSLARLAEQPAAVHGKVLFLGDYEPLDLWVWAGDIQAALGCRPIRRCPIALLRAAAALGDLAKHAGYRNPPLTSFRLANLLTDMVYDFSPLEGLVGPLPCSRREGVTASVAWLREQGLVR